MNKLLAILVAGCCVGLLGQAAFCGETTGAGAEIPAEDYPLYDQAVERLFVTPRTPALLIERMTVARLSPDQPELLTVEWFQEQGYFMGRLPRELVYDFVHVNRTVARLEGRFRFGSRYRFLSDGLLEEPEVLSRNLLIWKASELIDSTLSERLAFSRIGRTLRNDQALLYVEQFRPDGTGAGFLLWFGQEERRWKVLDTEVVWVIRGDEDGEEVP